jgi:hypothetical protein
MPLKNGIQGFRKRVIYPLNITKPVYLDTGPVSGTGHAFAGMGWRQAFYEIETITLSVSKSKIQMPLWFDGLTMSGN